MRIDETRSNHETRRIDGARGSQVCLARIADKYNAIATNANVGRSRFPARAIDKLAVKNEEVELLCLSTSR